MSSRSPLASIQAKYWTFLFAGLTSALYLLYKFAFRPGLPDPNSTKLLKDLANPKKIDDDDDDIVDDKDEKEMSSNHFDSMTSPSSKTTPLHSNKKIPSMNKDEQVNVDDIDGDDEDDLITQIHSQIEQIDKRGKALFKSKSYIEAAEVFSEAIDLINDKVKDVTKHGNLNRQLVTLINNRSAMYEKAGMPELALFGKLNIDDSCTIFIIICQRILFIFYSNFSNQL